jgi:hypothetical protein
MRGTRADRPVLQRVLKKDRQAESPEAITRASWSRRSRLSTRALHTQMSGRRWT